LTLVVLVGLAVLWAAVLLPPLLRSRTHNSRSVDSIGEFNYKLGVLRRTNGAAPSPMSRPPAVPVSMRAGAGATMRRPQPSPFGPTRGSSSQRAAKRRGDILRGLVVAVALTMALAYFTASSLLWGVQIVTDLALLAFLGLWAYARNGQLSSASSVHYLPQPRTPELALRRTASS
jgi:hypothetical protein